MTDLKPEVEDLGRCIGCDRPLRAGEIVTPWDDEVGHANCKNPTSFRYPDLPDDCPPAVMIVGNPARYVPVEIIAAALRASQEVG